MRKYQPAWNQLKQNHKEPLVISAHPAYHRRIFKAIKKEKHLDLPFHLLLSEDGKTSKLSSESKGNALTIHLHISVALYGMF